MKNQELICIEYVYRLYVYKNEVPQNNIHDSFLEDAIHAYDHDPKFHASYNMCRNLFFKLFEEIVKKLALETEAGGK